MNIIEQSEKYIVKTYGRFPVCFESGNGVTATDINGKTYIDMGSGIGVNSLGFCDETWVNAVCEQAKTLQHVSNYYYTVPQANLAMSLCEHTGYSKAFFGNSGAEANECAIKIARKYSCDKYGAEANRNVIITLKNSFHGRTITTLSATGQDNFHKNFFPFTEGFTFVIANDINDLISAVDDKICAIMFEPIQGEGGVIPMDLEYIKAVEKICSDKDILLIADEVQTGAGRTGKFLASEFLGVKPNIITLAKGLGGGLPIGVILTDEMTCEVLKISDHGTTFGGNPIACAGANAVVSKLLFDGFLDEVVKKGEYLRAKLLEIGEVESLTGMGLMVGITLKQKVSTEVAKVCLDEGLLVLTAKEKVRLLPPLTITYQEIDKAINILANVLK